MKTNNEPQTVNHEPSPSVPLTVYRPNQRHEMSWAATWIEMARNVWNSREMIWQLYKRDLIAQYKKSHIGILWMLAGPVMAVVPWIFAAKVRVYNPGQVDVPLAVYLILGRTMWGAFSGFYGNGVGTLGGGGALLSQVNFSHEAMLVKQVMSGLTGFALQLVTCLAVMLLSGVFPAWGALAFPLTLLPLFFLGAAMGLIVGMIQVVAYDLNRIIGILWGFLMWTTPLLYSDKVPSPLLQAVIKYNPLTYLVCSARDALLHGHVYNHQVGTYLICAAVSFALFLTSLRLFHVSEHKLIERMI